ncbi:MAG TPA: penicillin-binding protein 2 [Victivallales bacterium]|nr:penicillin-binding protein 2 [Victivallales bacterium]
MGRSTYTVKIIFIAVLIIGIFAYLAVHLYDIQIKEHKELYIKAKRKYTAVKRIRGSRGEINDSNGNLLVGNIPCIDIRANPQLVGNKDKCRMLAGFFSRKLNISASTVFKRLSTKKRGDRKIYEVVIKNAVHLNLADTIKEEVKDRDIKGIYFYDSVKRYYPKKKLLSNLLGFINVDHLNVIPVSGIERAYNSVLSPVKSEVSVYERSRKGVPLTYGNNKINTRKTGDNINLTIKEPIQSIVEEELNKLVEKWEPKSAYVVMVDPKTGSILAMAQRPTFNPNDRETMDSKSWQNRMVVEGLEPGSTMKPLVIAKALDLGLVSPDTVFYCEKGYWVYGKKSLRDSHSYEDLTVTQIIQKSSNIGTAKIALLLGKLRLYHLLRLYGFGQKTGLPFSPEATGILRKVKKWDTLSITRFPIGQGILVSPLQLIGAYTALANHGQRMRLRIIDKIEDPETGNSYTYPIKKEEKIFSYKTSLEIVEMMKLVTKSGGTARRAAVNGYEVAGKTGTSQKWVNGAYSHSKYFASFIGFVPADDPAFILLIVANEPKKSYYGGVVAAPTFNNIASKTLRYMDIPATNKTTK